MSPVAAQRLAIDFARDWYGLVGVYGGFVLASVADAAACIPGFELVSLTARFVSPTETAPAVLERTVLHHGSRTASVRLELEQDGRRTVDATAVLLPLGGAAPWEAELDDGRRPATTEPPADWSQRRHVQGELPFLRNLEVRTPDGFSPAEGSAAWLRLRERPESVGLQTPQAVACALMDALLPVPFGQEPPPRFVPTIEFTVHFTPAIGAVADGWVFGRNRMEWSTGAYCVEDATLCTPDGRLLARQRQARLIIWT